MCVQNVELEFGTNAILVPDVVFVPFWFRVTL